MQHTLYYVYTLWESVGGEATRTYLRKIPSCKYSQQASLRSGKVP